MTPFKSGEEKAIKEANIAVHRAEAKHYDSIHVEIFGRTEQSRLKSILKRVDGLITDNRRRALDFGAGTGNVTGKLLELDYDVTAVDISPEMCEILRSKFGSYEKRNRLRIIVSDIENAHFLAEQFDLVACYSVLHHLPDYIEVLRQLAGYLRRGGVMYLDHEASPFETQRNGPQGLMEKALGVSDRMLNRLAGPKTMGLSEHSTLDYSMSDYWTSEGNRLDHDGIVKAFEEMHFSYAAREDYHLSRSVVFNPVFYAYRVFCKPNASLWIAVK